MSLLWPDELRIVLAPEQVVLVRLVWKLTRHGPVPRVEEKNIVDFQPAAAGEAGWDAALKALEAGMSRLLPRKTVAKVVLSNHFMRYTLVPWSESLSDAAEEQAYARHCFRLMYGADAEQWDLRLSPQRDEFPQLASAVDSRLLAALRAMFERNGVVLKSVQPRLMAAYNNCRPALQECSAWFALYEPGSLCIALLQQGRWASVRTLRSGSNWCDALLLALERESYLAEENDAPQEVFLWAPELGQAALPESGRWTFHNLQPQLRAPLVAEYDERFAMALSG